MYFGFRRIDRRSEWLEVFQTFDITEAIIG